MERVPYQFNKNLLSKIQKYGCGLLCSLYIFDYQIKAEKVNILYKELQQSYTIDEDCYIKSWKKLTTILSKEKYTFVGILNPEYKCKENEKEMLQYFNERTNLLHFVVGENNKVVWDSLGDSITVKEGKIISKRVFRKIT